MGRLVGVLFLAVAGAGVLVAARQGRSWGAFLLAGAGGWIGAQVLKGLLSAPVILAGAHGQPAARALALAGDLTRYWWFPFYGALLPGLAEPLGKYFPLRWLRVSDRPAALALGLGAGIAEVVSLGLPLLLGSAAGAGPTALAAGIALWERGWALALHAGLATLAGVAVAQRRARWLTAAMAVHFLADLPVGYYQRAAALGAGDRVLALAVAEVGAAVLALVALAWGRRGWAGVRAARAGAGATGG